jgi:hypothetical protein
MNRLADTRQAASLVPGAPKKGNIMKYAVLFAAASALALSACENSETTDAAAAPTQAAEAADATETAAAAPAGAAAFTAGQPPSKEFMVGTWGEGDDCELPINFQADGTIKDGPADTWTIEDGQLVMGGMFKLKVTVVDENTMESLAEGSTETDILKRCD